MNYTLDQSLLIQPQAAQRITDIEYISKYCSGYYEQLPLLLGIIIFISITLLALLEDRIGERFASYAWHAIIFMCWTASMMLIVLNFSLIW